jgi:hypothetical protein
MADDAMNLVAPEYSIPMSYQFGPTILQKEQTQATIGNMLTDTAAKQYQMQQAQAEAQRAQQARSVMSNPVTDESGNEDVNKTYAKLAQYDPTMAEKYLSGKNQQMLYKAHSGYYEADAQKMLDAAKDNLVKYYGGVSGASKDLLTHSLSQIGTFKDAQGNDVTTQIGTMKDLSGVTYTPRLGTKEEQAQARTQMANLIGVAGAMNLNSAMTIPALEQFDSDPQSYLQRQFQEMVGWNGHYQNSTGGIANKKVDATNLKTTTDAAQKQETITGTTTNGSPTEQKRHNIAMENKPSAGSVFQQLSPDENTALSNAITNGLDPHWLNSRTAKVFAQQELEHPGWAWNSLSAAATFERSQSTQNTQALLNSINPLMDNLLVAGKALGNTNSQFMNKAVNWTKEQMGSPDIVQFNNQRDDMIAEIERGLLGTGVLSDSKYLRAIHNVNSAQSYPQLEAAIRATKLIIQTRLNAIREKSGVGARTTPESTPADAQGAAATQQPSTVKSAKGHVYKF